MRTPLNTKQDKTREGWLEVKNLEQGDVIYFCKVQPTYNKFGLIDWIGKLDKRKLYITGVEVKGGYTTVTYYKENPFEINRFYHDTFTKRFRSKTRSYYLFSSE